MGGLVCRKGRVVLPQVQNRGSEMPTLELEFEVYCSCGKGLCRNTTEGKNHHSVFITIEPCEDCLERSRTEGYDEARKEIENEGVL